MKWNTILMKWLVEAQKLLWWANQGTSLDPCVQTVSDQSKLTAYHYNTDNACLLVSVKGRWSDETKPESLCTQARAHVCVSHRLHNLDICWHWSPKYKIRPPANWEGSRLVGAKASHPHLSKTPSEEEGRILLIFSASVKDLLLSLFSVDKHTQRV